MRKRAAYLVAISVAAICCRWNAAQAGDAPSADKSNNARLRIIIETDAGGDPDDEQSLVRFLLYANEWDVEAIIANRPHARDGENLNPVRDGYGIVRRMVDAYGECHAHLKQHDAAYPTVEQLRRVTVAGYEDKDDGVKLVMAAVDRDDPRPVWFCNWGTDDESASSSLKRALDRVLAERGQDGYAKFKRRLRLASYDKFGEHTRREPAWPLWVQTWQPELDHQRWYHRFSAITATAGGFDLERDCLKNHGPLGALYPTNTTHRQKEGDSACFLYLVPTGMNDPNEPTWGSWAGRYGPREDFRGKPYYWANARDAWRASSGGRETTHRENTLRRWAADLQNDFRARLDWCVRDARDANHAPTVHLQQQGGKAILHRRAAPGEAIALSAAGTTDRDGNKLAYQWCVYNEAGAYGRAVAIDDADREAASIKIPADAAGKTIHVLLRVVDNGEPPLAAYRRVVIEAIAKEDSNR
jgi:hypothetical protein